MFAVFSIRVLLLGMVILIKIRFNKAENKNENIYEFTTDNLPVDTKDMPVISNGHIGFVIFSEALYMNGLYNGHGGLSHRAKIPNYSNIQLKLCFTNSTKRNCTYTLNTHEGYFRITYYTTEFRVDQYIYAHRYYNRAVINHFIIGRLNSTDKITVELNTNDENIISEDLELLNANFVNRKLNILKRCGRTIALEDMVLQQKYRKVCLLWNAIPKSIVLNQNEHRKVFTYIMTADTRYSVAKKEFFNVFYQNYSSAFENHTSTWKLFWSDFNITLDGNVKLARTIQSSIYAIVSALPSLESNLKVHDLPYGLSPTGLGRGGSNLEDYEGHIFWDNEIWMFPNILLFNQKWAKMLMNYRFGKIKAAEMFANSSGYKGIRFPWETGYTGVDVVQPGYAVISQNQIHISADISFALYNYIATTNDMQWLQRKGCILGIKIAEFFASRVQYNNISDTFDIHNVMGPDEDHADVENNAYTNVIAAHALYSGDFWTCACGISSKNWTEIGDKLKIVYDGERDFHPQYAGYEWGTEVKQADAILLQYPLYYPMSSSTRSNDLDYYASVTRPSGPAMTWSIFAINYLKINKTDKGAEYFNKSWQPYVTQPFYVWHELDSETSNIELGASNFITGAGGFLQTILNGYGGIKYDINELVIGNCKLPPNVNCMEINGIKYLNLKINVKIDNASSSLIEIQQNEGQKYCAIEVFYRNSTVDLIESYYAFTLQTDETITIRASHNLYGACTFHGFTRRDFK